MKTRNKTLIIVCIILAVMSLLTMALSDQVVLSMLFLVAAMCITGIVCHDIETNPYRTVSHKAKRVKFTSLFDF